jgi:hypothetical protein
MGVQSVIALEGTENHSNKFLLVTHIGFVTIIFWQFCSHGNNEDIRYFVYQQLWFPTHDYRLLGISTKLFCVIHKRFDQVVDSHF